MSRNAGGSLGKRVPSVVNAVGNKLAAFFVSGLPTRICNSADPVKNSKGTLFYGMHFYPGVAEYAEPGKDAFRVFLNEDTIRAMGPSFTGRPVFVQHVDEVEESVDELRKEADGWVVRSFYNEADGKHWAEFMIVSERGLKAIRDGYRLSNCYLPKGFGKGGLWNGVSYSKEVTKGEYEHLALVTNPRYDESVVLTPDAFKRYNEDKQRTLDRLQNEKDQDMALPKLKLFKRTQVEKIENGVKLEELALQLDSGREVTIHELVDEANKAEKAKGKARVVNAIDLVEVEVEGEKKQLAVSEVVAFFNAGHCAPVENEGDESMENEDDEEKAENEDDEEKTENEDDEEPEEKPKKNAKKKNAKKKKNSADDEDAGLTEDEVRKKREAKAKADKLRNARDTKESETAVVDLSLDRVAVGKQRYGSSN